MLDFRERDGIGYIHHSMLAAREAADWAKRVVFGAVAVFQMCARVVLRHGSVTACVYALYTHAQRPPDAAVVCGRGVKKFAPDHSKALRARGRCWRRREGAAAEGDALCIPPGGVGSGRRTVAGVRGRRTMLRCSVGRGTISGCSAGRRTHTKLFCGTAGLFCGACGCARARRLGGGRARGGSSDLARARRRT